MLQLQQKLQIIMDLALVIVIKSLHLWLLELVREKMEDEMQHVVTVKIEMQPTDSNVMLEIHSYNNPYFS